MAAGDVDVVRRVYAAFAQRSADELVDLLHPEIEFWAVTGEEIGRDEPYRGLEGMRRYMEDANAVWDELRLVPHEFELYGDLILVTGRVYARRPGQVVDSSAGWHWRVRDGRVIYGRVFRSSEEAQRAVPGAGAD